MINAEQMARLQRWAILNKQLGEIKAEEMELRRSLASELTGDLIGTHRLAIPETPGWKLKVVNGERVDLEKDRLELLPSIYAELIAAGLDEHSAGQLVKTKLELSVSAYGKLSAVHQKIMQPVVVTKPASPTMEIEMPKGGK